MVGSSQSEKFVTVSIYDTSLNL